MNNSEMMYVDMDGVIADWVAGYNALPNVPPLAVFNEMSREEKEDIKREIFTYEFFANLPVLERGMNILRELIASNANVCILSAVGRVNVDEVATAKIHWLRRNGINCPVMFVDKVENKATRMLPGYASHVLIDDRARAIDAWIAAGGHGVLFV